MSATILPSKKAEQIIGELTVFGDQLETLDNPQWIVVAKAAALLEAIRLGLLAIETQPGGEVRHA